MKLKKLLLYAVGVLVVCVAAFFLFGLITKLLFYAFVASLLVIGGTVTYKLLTRQRKPELQGDRYEKQIAYVQQDMEKSQILLEDYKRKLLVEKKNQ